jgi:hypothetical protein
MVGPGEQGGLRAWTFTSDGKTYEHPVTVKASQKECVVTVGMGERGIAVKFVHTGENTFDVEYKNDAARKAVPVRATFTKEARKG